MEVPTRPWVPGIDVETTTDDIAEAIIAIEAGTEVTTVCAITEANLRSGIARAKAKGYSIDVPSD